MEPFISRNTVELSQSNPWKDSEVSDPLPVQRNNGIPHHSSQHCRRDSDKSVHRECGQCS